MMRAEYASTQPEGPRRAERSEHGGPWSAAQRGGARPFHTDQKGTVEVVSTSSGDSTRREYDVWGAPQFRASDELTRSGYTGHQHDADLGLIDMRGRIYDPLAGRFLTPDPIMQAPFWSQGLNRYSYVFNDPVNRAGLPQMRSVMPSGSS